MRLQLLLCFAYTNSKLSDEKRESHLFCFNGRAIFYGPSHRVLSFVSVSNAGNVGPVPFVLVPSLTSTIAPML